MKSFKQFITEYELSGDDVAPSSTKEDDIDHDAFHKHDMGKVGKFSVTHYKSRKPYNPHYTFVKDEHGSTIGHIEHKPVKKGRLAISNITRDKTDSKGNKIEHRGLMTDVLHHMVKHGHTLESDNTNTEHGAHKMLMNLANKPDVKTACENGKGDVIPHDGDITSHENQKLYSIKHTDPTFLDNKIHKHVLVFNKA